MSDNLAIGVGALMHGMTTDGEIVPIAVDNDGNTIPSGPTSDAGAMLYGDGSDGPLTLVDTLVQADQRAYTNISVDLGAIFYSNGVPVVCQDKLIIEGTISDYLPINKTGKNGANGTGGNGAGGSALNVAINSGCLWYHWKNNNANAWGVGGNGGKSGTPATSGTSPQNYFGYAVFPIGGQTGNGGNGGGTSTPGAGGQSVCYSSIYPLTHLLKGAIGLWSGDGGWRYLYGGVNGSGGGGGDKRFDGDSVYYTGGGGGGGGLGGGIIVIYANELEIGENGLIDASGGNGGVGGDGYMTAGGGGGGSAGGGGIVAILCNKLTCADDVANHINVAGGIGGLGGSLTNPTESWHGIKGGDGLPGRWMVVELSTGSIYHG